MFSVFHRVSIYKHTDYVFIQPPTNNLKFNPLLFLLLTSYLLCPFFYFTLLFYKVISVTDVVEYKSTITLLEDCVCHNIHNAVSQDVMLYSKMVKSWWKSTSVVLHDIISQKS
jgi:ABC-type enterochelin transport system ATPase subunit